MHRETNGQPMIRLEDLCVGYKYSLKPNQVIYGPVNAEISHAEMVAVIGRNGIGKSTLIRTIAGIQPSIGGHVFIDGIQNNKLSDHERAKKVSFVSTEIIHMQHMKVHEVIALGRFPYTNWLGRSNRKNLLIIHQAANQTGVNHLMQKSLFELSDGERQKVMIARALAQDTPVIILDEPTAFLDLPARYEILRIMNHLTVEKGKTILYTTHDLSLAMDISDKLWIMAEGEIFQGAPEDLLISKVFRKLFLNSPAEFDVKTSSFRFRKEFRFEAVIHGEKKFQVLTKRALERIGYKVKDDGASGTEISIQDVNESPLWLVRKDNNLHTFHTLYDLTTFLKILK